MLRGPPAAAGNRAHLMAAFQQGTDERTHERCAACPGRKIRRWRLIQIGGNAGGGYWPQDDNSHGVVPSSVFIHCLPRISGWKRLLYVSCARRDMRCHLSVSSKIEI